MSEDFPNDYDGNVKDQDYSDYTMDDVSAHNQVYLSNNHGDDASHQPNSKRKNTRTKKKAKQQFHAPNISTRGKSRGRGGQRRGSHHQQWSSTQRGRGRGRGGGGGGRGNRPHRGRGRGRGGRGRGRQSRRHASNYSEDFDGQGDGYRPANRSGKQHSKRVHPYAGGPQPRRSRKDGKMKNRPDDPDGKQSDESVERILPSATCLPACQELKTCICRQGVSLKYTDPDQFQRLTEERRELSQLDRFTSYMVQKYGVEMPGALRLMNSSVYDDEAGDYEILNNKYQDITISWLSFYKILENEKRLLFQEGIEEFEPTGGAVRLEDCEFPTPQEPALAPAIVRESAVYTNFGSGTPFTPVMPIETPTQTPRTPIGPQTTEEQLYGRSDEFNSYLGSSTFDNLHAGEIE